MVWIWSLKKRRKLQLLHSNSGSRVMLFVTAGRVLFVAVNLNMPCKNKISSLSVVLGSISTVYGKRKPFLLGNLMCP